MSEQDTPTLDRPVRVLIVDDEPPARKRLTRLLKAQDGFEMIGECPNGKEALDTIQTEQPDLVLLDVQMPELSGLEVLEALDPETMPVVVFVTAYDQHALRAFELHAVDYLLKPFDDERFEVAVGKAFVEDRDQLNAACSLIGVLKVLVVLNIWGLKNTRVQLILAAVAVPGFALVIYAHMALGDLPSAYMPAVVFMVLLPKTAFAMLRGDEAEEPSEASPAEAAPAPAPKTSGRTGKHKKR